MNDHFVSSVHVVNAKCGIMVIMIIQKKSVALSKMHFVVVITNNRYLHYHCIINNCREGLKESSQHYYVYPWETS